jgi:hypothetical protein
MIPGVHVKQAEYLTSQSRVSVGDVPVIACPMHIAGMASRRAAARVVRYILMNKNVLLHKSALLFRNFKMK